MSALLQKGRVWQKQLTIKAGVSGSKAACALLTGGTPLRLTGLSAKQSVTRLNCRNYGVSWSV